MSKELEIFQKPSELSAYLQRSRGAIEMALPKHLNADRMLRLALTSFSTTPKLRECTGQSILASIVVASQIGLEPGVAGQGYLIPYGRNCTFVPGWQGLVSLLNNSGRATAWSGAVYEGDVWDFQLGSFPKCVHIPGENYGDETKLTWVYACGKVNGSEQPVIEAWNMARVWKHRDRFNKVGGRHYSFEHREMYARKVVLLQVLKYMPRSIELSNAIAATHAAEEGRTSRVEDGVVIDIPGEQVDTVASPRGRKTQNEKPATPDGGGTTHSEPESPQEASAEPLSIPEDPTELVKFIRTMIDERDLDEPAVVNFLKARHKIGSGCKGIGEAAQSGLRWLAENIEMVKNEIAAL